MSEFDKMKEHVWYDANYDPDILKLRAIADDRCFMLNSTMPSDTEKRGEILKGLIGDLGKDVTILSPFYCDYGDFIEIGEATFINHNAYLMDGGGIRIGSHCFIGPNCGMYTAQHPLIAEERNRGFERALPIEIGDDCWIGADVTILPGVRIGKGSVIGAKSVVTKDVPDGAIVAGNPCRVLRYITEKDSVTNTAE